MAPFVSTRSRLRDSILTFRALFNDTYAVDTDQAIDHMAKRIVERGDFDQVWSIFCPDATKESLRQYMAESQDRILGIKNEIELSASEAEDAM